MTALFDHLWQSTLVAGALGPLTLLFRDNRAGIRYALWFAASMKFLLPFSVLTLLGGALFPAPTFVAPDAFYRMQPAAQPFAAASPVLSAQASTVSHLQPLLLALWACGFMLVLSIWAFRGMRLRAIIMAARDLPAAGLLKVKSSPAQLEPGLIGVWRPILLLPEGIVARLSPRELQAVTAHEFCHYRRRDNLTAALHMLVAAIFWFYPLVWWLGTRLVEERENACDERVLESGSDPQTYAESILKVCRFYLHSPLACAAGISGADLNKRMEKIMENKSPSRLSAMKKVLLGFTAAVAIAAPVLAGFVTASHADAPSPQQIKANLAEQALPRKEIAIDPAAFDKFVGYYRLTPNVIFVISRSGNHYFEGSIGQTPVEMYPESDSKFFLQGLSLPAQFSFTRDAEGRVTELVLHQAGEEQHAPRVDDAIGKAAESRSRTPHRGECSESRHGSRTPPSARRAYERHS